MRLLAERHVDRFGLRKGHYSLALGGTPMEDVRAQQKADEPEAGADESKGLVSLPLAAVATFGQAAPVEWSRAGKVVVNKVDEQAERCEPSHGQNQVPGVMEEGKGEGNQEDKR